MPPPDSAPDQRPADNLSSDERPSSGRYSPLQFTALFAAAALAFLGNGLQSTLTGVRASAEQMPNQTIGLVMSSFFLGYLVGSLLAPHLIQRVGHIRTFAAFASTASGLALAFPIFVDPAVWIGLRLLNGACFAGMLIIVESWLNAGSSSAVRGRTLAAYGIVVYLAWALSQPLLTVAPPGGFVLFCLVSMLLSFSLVPLALTRAGTPGTVLADRVGLRRLFSVSPTAVVGSLSLGLGVSAFWGMAPAWGEQVGLPYERLSSFLSTVLLGALVLQWPLGWLSDLLDRRLVLGLSLLSAMAAAAVLWAIAGNGTPFLFTLAFLLGGLAMPSYALCVAHANDHVDTNEVVAVSSGLLIVYGAGSAAGPVLASLAMNLLGPSWLFAVVGFWLLVAGAYALSRMVMEPT